MKRPTTESVKRQWAFERCFRNKGLIVSASAALKRVAADTSTMLDETVSLSSISKVINDVLTHWDDGGRRARSLRQFKDNL